MIRKDEHRYDDIINLQYPRPGHPSRMTVEDRAAQFAPFAALTGHDAAIAEAGRLTQACIELDEDEKALLDEKLRWIAQNLRSAPEVTLVYFEPDQRKAGGAYIRHTGIVRKVSVHQSTLLMADGTVIPFAQICDIMV